MSFSWDSVIRLVCELSVQRGPVCHELLEKKVFSLFSLIPAMGSNSNGQDYSDSLTSYILTLHTPHLARVTQRLRNKVGMRVNFVFKPKGNAKEPEA